MIIVKLCMNDDRPEDHALEPRAAGGSRRRQQEAGGSSRHQVAGGSTCRRGGSGRQGEAEAGGGSTCRRRQRQEEAAGGRRQGRQEQEAVVFIFVFAGQRAAEVTGRAGAGWWGWGEDEAGAVPGRGWPCCCAWEVALGKGKQLRGAASKI